MKIEALIMSKTEVKPISIQVVDLLSTETVTAATVTHVPPSGTAATITPSVSSPYITLLLGPLTVAGKHTVKVQATGSLGSKPEVLYKIDVLDV